MASGRKVKRELTNIRPHLQSPSHTSDTPEDVHMTLNDFAPRTRGQASAVRRFAAEAGIGMPEEQADRQAASSSGESDTGSEDDGFPRVPTQKNPWPNVNDQASVQAWILWDDEQGEFQAFHTVMTTDNP